MKIVIYARSLVTVYREVLKRICAWRDSPEFRLPHQDILDSETQGADHRERTFKTEATRDLEVRE